jgi:hypothetical protein
MLAIRCNALRFDCTLLGSAGYGLATPAPIGPQARPRGNTRAVCRGDRCRVGKHCPPISAVRVGNKLPTLLGLISNGRTTRTFSIATRNAVRTSGNTSTRCRRSVTTVKKYVPPATLARRYRAMTIIRKTNGFMVARVSRRRNPWNQRGQIRRQAARVSRQRNPQNQRFNLAPNRGLMKPTRPTGLAREGKNRKFCRPHPAIFAGHSFFRPLTEITNTTKVA